MTIKSSEFALKLTPNAFQELGTMARLSDKLADIEDCSRRLGPAPGRREAAKGIADALGLPENDVRQLLYGLLNLHSVQQSLDIDVADLLSAMISEADDQGSTSWKTENLNKLVGAQDKIADTLRKLTPDHPLSVCRKAEQLTYKHQNFLSDSHIITDLRPVFSEAGDEILESVITHTLWIEYYDGRNRRIEIAMDATDLAELRQWCERAERKALTLTDSLKSMRWPTTIARQKSSEQHGN